jgi:hypothetical protein
MRVAGLPFTHPPGAAGEPGASRYLPYFFLFAAM